MLNNCYKCLDRLHVFSHTYNRDAVILLLVQYSKCCQVKELILNS